MIGTPPNQGKTKVLVAMSGGVDSSVAAALLVRAGHEVVGVFMRLGSPGESLETPIPGDDACNSPKIGHQGCCSIADAADARLVAAELGIPFYVCNFKKDFGRIIDHFADEYLAGRTPNPCVRCNDWLKFGKLHDYARQMGATHVASGHHARVEARGGQPTLLRGVDPKKDQSYVLFGAPRERLSEMMLPIGGYHKDEVRDLASTLGLPTFDKPESQEICFVPGNDYTALVERVRPGSARPGVIQDREGKALGTHGGQHRFTIGQRRRVGVALGHPIYVVAKDPEANTVTVGSRDDLKVSSCTAAEANWLVDVPSGEMWRPCIAKYRYNGGECVAECRVSPPATGPTPSGRSGRFEVRFAEPQDAVTPGQAVVLYDAAHRDAVLGGGWIEHARP